MRFKEFTNGPIRINVAEEGEGPVILCVHGWPELWYSWRHQITKFSEIGFKVCAMDVRGYGGSSKPLDVASYSLKNLASDVAAVAANLSDEPVVLFGHDWGAPIVWHTALLHPDRVRAVAGLSVPYTPGTELSFLDLAEQIYQGRFFYQKYFQEEGVAERELEADPEQSLRKIYFSLSGDAPLDDWLKEKSETKLLLDELDSPDPFPDWLSDSDLRIYAEAFERGGFRGPLNRYRAQRIDLEELKSLRRLQIKQPACFIGGERDSVRHFVPGMDLFSAAGNGCDDYRGTTIISGAGHWVQQERPAETNEALERFLSDL